MFIILEDNFKKINELGFEFRKTKDEKIKDNIEKELKSIISDMKKNAIEKFKDESDLKTFLDNCIKFNNYSYNNLFWIWMQKPEATYVSSFKNYSKMGYTINKGAKGIKVLIPTLINLVKITNSDGKYEIKPYYLLSDNEKERYKNKEDESVAFYKQKLTGFSIGNVFDASDTTMPIEDIKAELDPVLVDKRADEIIDCLIKAVYKDGYKVKYEEFKDSVKGYCDHKEKQIVVKKGLGNLMQLKVLIHEYAHALAHKHLENNHEDYKIHRNKYETEAESIAYCVSKYLGLDSGGYSLNYLYSWSREKDFKEVDDSLNTIVNFSKKIIKNFEKFYNQEFGLYSDYYKEMKV